MFAIFPLHLSVPADSLLKMDINKIFDTVEKVFRYLVPAFVFTFLFKHCDNGNYTKYIAGLDNIKFALYFILSGMTIYSIHRVLFELIDYIIFKANKKSILSHYINISNIKNNKIDYFYYKMATFHSVLITMELTIIFIVYYWKCEYLCVFITCIILFIFTFIVYWNFNRLQIDLIEKLSLSKGTDSNTISNKTSNIPN